MADPITVSQQTQQLIDAAGVAAAADKAAAQQVGNDNDQIGQLNQQLAQAGAALAQHQQDAQRADQANNSAYIAACQSLANDFGVPLPQTIPAGGQPAPAPPPAPPTPTPPPVEGRHDEALEEHHDGTGE